MDLVARHSVETLTVQERAKLRQNDSMTVTYGSQPDQTLVAGLQHQFDSHLERAIGRHARVALLDYPYTRNSGDAAIWLGERAALKRLGAQVVYTCETESYRGSSLRQALGTDGIILLSGGGNFGDYWPQHQRFREAVIQDFPDHQIVQLPQSIGISDPANVPRIKKAFHGRDNFVFFARDQQSHGMAESSLGLRACLVPDAVFALGNLNRPSRPRSDILVLARTDHEAAVNLSNVRLPGATIEDWTLGPWSARAWKAKKIIPRLAKRWATNDSKDALWAPPRELMYRSMAKQTVRAACLQLSSHRVVVTDRLHAHVLATLLGIPHVVLDNNYGKISGVHNAWTSDSETTLMARSLVEAEDMAHALLDQSANLGR